MPTAKCAASYFEHNPVALLHEPRAAGIDPLRDPLGYWRIELREIEHDGVRRSVNCSGVMTLADFYEWAAVNRREYEQGRWKEQQEQPQQQTEWKPRRTSFWQALFPSFK